MPIINMNTGKVLVTDKQLTKDVKKFLASKTTEEWEKIIKEEMAKDNIKELNDE